MSRSHSSGTAALSHRPASDSLRCKRHWWHAGISFRMKRTRRGRTNTTRSKASCTRWRTVPRSGSARHQRRLDRRLHKRLRRYHCYIYEHLWQTATILHPSARPGFPVPAGLWVRSQGLAIKGYQFPSVTDSSLIIPEVPRITLACIVHLIGCPNWDSPKDKANDQSYNS